MTVTAAPTVKDHELAFGLVESASVNSITDFIPSKLIEKEAENGKLKDDFSNIFICHLIFYALLCISLVVYILIDLGFGKFIKNKLVQFIELGNKTIFEKRPAFA